MSCAAKIPWQRTQIKTACEKPFAQSRRKATLLRSTLPQRNIFPEGTSGNMRIFLPEFAQTT